MNGEGRRSREAVRNSVRAYGVKVMDPASLPLKKMKKTESQESVSRFSEKSLHSQYEIREGKFRGDKAMVSVYPIVSDVITFVFFFFLFSGSCKDLLLRIPYGTIFGTFICVLGLLLATISYVRILSLEDMMFKDILKRDPSP